MRTTIATARTTPPATRATSQGENPPVLETRGLTKVFGRGEHALRAVDDVDLTVRRGEVVALLGPNGAGKTTTIKMIAGLVTPTSGDVSVLGTDLRRHRGAAVRKLGAVLEGGRNVYWAMSALQNLIYFGRLRGLRRKEITPRAEWLLGELGLWERRHEHVGGYSRGMQQKVAIAAALVSNPAVLLLDEPTIGLDVSAARTVKSWIRNLASAAGVGIVLTTHQLAVAEELSHRVAVIRKGRIITNQPVSDLLNEFREDRYEVVVDAPPSALPEPLLAESVAPSENGDETTRLVIPDTDGLYDVLDSLATRRLPLVSVAPVRPDLEEVFVRLVGEEER